MRLKLELATPADAPAIALLRVAVNEHLTLQYGKGPWSSIPTGRGVLFDMKTGAVWLARRKDRVMATLKLSHRKPWAIDPKYFTACERPLYLTAMAVHPEQQRRGVGRLCVEEIQKIARGWPADAIRLDAYDARAGAGGFYRKCGFREVGRVAYRNTPLIYFEMPV